MHPVKKLIGNRASGKTYRLFEMAEKNGGYVLTTNKMRETLQNSADAYGFHVDVISQDDIYEMMQNVLKESIKAGCKTFEERLEFFKQFDTDVYIDDLDELIDDFLPPFIKVQAVTLTAGYEVMIATYQNKDTKK